MKEGAWVYYGRRRWWSIQSFHYNFIDYDARGCGVRTIGGDSHFLY